MLEELWVRNLALVESLQARFRPGLNAITGETGAGKSLVVGAIDLALGARASSGLVRAGAEEAEVVARFAVGRDGEESTLLRRVVGADGRSRAYVNDRPVTVGHLREVGATLADLHGQHEQQALLRDETHLDVLDAYAGTGELRSAVREQHRELLALRQSRRDLEERLRRAAEERELNEFLLRELEDADLREGEESELERELHVAGHAERLAESVEQARNDLTEGDPSAEQLLGRVSRELDAAVRLDESLAAIRRSIDEALVTCEDAARELARYADGLDGDPRRLREVEDRLALLSNLKRKHRSSVADLIVKRDSLREDLDDQHEGPSRIDTLIAEEEVARDRLLSSAADLSAKRSRAGAALARLATREIRGLGMAGARFAVEWRDPRGAEPLGPRSVGPAGAEDAVFFLAANPGEAPGPLATVASGGEVSRVMLALRNVIRRVDPVPVVIFDEVDTGIGGVVAEAVGSRLRAISRERQVLVVTHLAVVAGQADHHLSLDKETGGKRTRVVLRELDAAGRERELARMLAGSRGGAGALATARTLLASSRKETRT